MAERAKNTHLVAFLERNKNTPGCWEWYGRLDADGYGRTKFNGRTTVAHRAVYRVAGGAIPDGMLLCHKCDNPSCCRPDHMFVGTQKENCADAKAKDRHSRGERNGCSRLKDDDVRFIRANAGTMTQMALARRFGIRQSSIWLIINRRQWAHVAD